MDEKNIHLNNKEATNNNAKQSKDLSNKKKTAKCFILFKK